LLRIGQGFDVHAFAEKRKLILCGVEVPYAKGLLGHSDADVAIHALMDALLGAAALGDIGKHFSDIDARYKDADSMKLLETLQRDVLGEVGIHNVDITIIAQVPKLAPYVEEMRARIAAQLVLDLSQVSVKATTTEHLGFTGRKEGIAALATVLLNR